MLFIPSMETNVIFVPHTETASRPMMNAADHQRLKNTPTGLQMVMTNPSATEMLKRTSARTRTNSSNRVSENKVNEIVR